MRQYVNFRRPPSECVGNALGHMVAAHDHLIMQKRSRIRKLQPSPRYVPYIRPSPPYIIDLLPPKAYPDNASKSLCTKFVHTSTNKIRCPVNAVTVRHIKIEHKLSRMWLSHIQSAWFNPPRRRRILARSLLEWQELYDTTSALGEKGNPTDKKDHLLINALELYVDDEKSFVYWELSHVVHEHLATLNSLEPVIPKGEAHPQARGICSKRRFDSQIPGLTENLSSYTHISTLSDHSAQESASRLALNFVRRYKWAFRPEYASASAEVLKEEQEPLRLHFERARDGLAELNRLPAGVAGPWHEDRLQVARSLSSIAGELALAVPATIVGLNDFDAAR
ncbi:hypothetical protein F5888DRAFT_1634777 [Russula emetica]|nr:hypothetical protein F5888DRAFT_1634777 [Russula emetica]